MKTYQQVMLDLELEPDTNPDPYKYQRNLEPGSGSGSRSESKLYGSAKLSNKQESLKENLLNLINFKFNKHSMFSLIIFSFPDPENFSGSGYVGRMDPK